MQVAAGEEELPARQREGAGCGGGQHLLLAQEGEQDGGEGRGAGGGGLFTRGGQLCGRDEDGGQPAGVCLVDHVLGGRMGGGRGGLH